MVQHRQNNTEQAERRLRQSHETLLAILDSIDALVYVADMATHELLFLNAYGKRVFGEITGKLCWQALQSGQSGPCVFCTNDKLLTDKGEPAEVYAWEFQNTVNNRWYEIRDRAIQWVDGRIVRLELAMDITDRWTMEEQLRWTHDELESRVQKKIAEHKKLEDQLRQAQKMEAIGTLAGGVAHDFNNILTAIIGYTHLILMDSDENTPFRHEVSAIREAADRAAALTGQLLAFSRRQVLEMKIINLNELIGNLAKFLKRIIGEDIALDIQTERPVKSVMADPGQLEQVIMNLVANARDAMPCGGKLLIETADVVFGLSDTGRLLSAEVHEYVLLTVSDTGTGMTDDIQEKIFEPFFTTKEPDKGTGLGLSTVYGIVKQHKGDLCVDSAPGRGTVFKVFLPALQNVPVKEAEGCAGLVGGTETILLVDDDPEVRTVVSALLTHLGYKVHEAPGAREALRFGGEYRERIHALLTDVVMPDMNGKQLAESFCVRHPETAVLYMSGHTEHAIARHGILDSGANCIQKPVVVSKLAHKLREVLGGKKGI